MDVHQLATPALLVDRDAFDANVATMGAVRPGAQLRPHVKAFKSTELAGELAAAGHPAFCAATVRELAGMASAGLGHDLLLANETVNVARLRALADGPEARVTVAVDSAETIDAAAAGGIGEVLIDVNVGLPRCGCDPADAGRLADQARARGLLVRGVMGYEGHLMMADPAAKAEKVEEAMAVLAAAHADVGGDVVSAGGTGTAAVNRWCTEVQAGSFTLMDGDYRKAGLPFQQALFLLLTVISVNRAGGWAVLDGGLKCLGMDHGNPAVVDGTLWFCSDEHITYAPDEGVPMPRVGDRVRVIPAHVDPTVAYHEQLHVVRGDEVVGVWPIDLRVGEVDHASAFDLALLSADQDGALYDLFERIVADGEGFPQAPPLDRHAYEDQWCKPGTTVIVATVDGALAGAAYLKPNSPGRAAHIANAGYVVAAEFRGRGIGRALVEDTIARAPTLGFDAIQFNLVFESNPARALYEQLGWQEIGRVPNAVNGEPAIIYWRAV